MQMEVVHTEKELRLIISKVKASGKQVGFVPTMGALHKGHISLVRHAHAKTDFVVASIFVNPTQFNDKSDLDKYPRTLDSDLKMLEEEKCDLVFVPNVKEVYPEEDIVYLDIDLGLLDHVMEGEHRPGHFEGVALVVYRFFEMVEPDFSFFGEKDFQQVAVIRSMVEQTKLPVQIIACRTVREQDGLAMSSRNMRLTEEHRNAAPLIADSLFEAQKMSGEWTVEDAKAFVKERISQNKLFRLEYFEIVDKNTLLAAKDWNTPNGCVACIAVWAGDVRLIDNIQF